MPIHRFVWLQLASILSVSSGASAIPPSDAALDPPRVVENPGPEYAASTRPFQGIPGIECAANGRLWATWYGGGPTECRENYAMLATSAGDPAKWSDVKLVVDVPGLVRVFDPCLWHDPDGRLWFFWAQGFTWWDGRAGVWAMVTSNSSDEKPTWSKPRRLCDGIMMNKPIALSNGDWLLPVSIWSRPPQVTDPAHVHDTTATTGSHVYASSDHGKTWTLRGTSNVDERMFDEHMVVERKDGVLWELVRTNYGIGEAFSKDRGATWEGAGPSKTVTHIPSARFFIRRLASGKLLLVRHNPPDMKTRSHLTAYLSEDDGRTWTGGFLLDDRECSYPDGVQASDGTVHVIYDHERKGAKQILVATFMETDIAAGKPVSGKTKLRMLVNQATGTDPSAKEPAR
ncbi:MAG: exo-alpha-sialidase [Candidatus Hydrogenedentes bacterium]|nr:exo-alpha-sialidase [Candidatus Hydrogenedentota bacterium]